MFCCKGPTSPTHAILSTVHFKVDSSIKLFTYLLHFYQPEHPFMGPELSAFHMESAHQKYLSPHLNTDTKNASKQPHILCYYEVQANSRLTLWTPPHETTCLLNHPTKKSIEYDLKNRIAGRFTQKVATITYKNSHNANNGMAYHFNLLTPSINYQFI
jgi:hypothetical protein